jgi:hypothetical protein
MVVETEIRREEGALAAKVTRCAEPRSRYLVEPSDIGVDDRGIDTALCLDRGQRGQPRGIRCLGGFGWRYPDGAPRATRRWLKFRPSIVDQPPGSPQRHWCPRAIASVSAPLPDAHPVSIWGDSLCSVAIGWPAATIWPLLTRTVIRSATYTYLPAKGPARSL